MLFTIPSLVLRQTFLFAQFTFIALIDAVDHFSFFRKLVNQFLIDDAFDLFHAIAGNFTDENIFITVYRQPWQFITFAMDQPACPEIIRHDIQTVLQSIFHPSGPKGMIKYVIGIAGQQPDADLALFTVETCAKVIVTAAKDINQTAVCNISFL